MGYTPVPDEQWTADDLAAAEAARNHKAIDAARRAGNLHDLLNPQAEQTAVEPPTDPVGPTVPDMQPGGAHTGSGVGQMSRAELDALTAAGDYAGINQARRNGRLTNLGA